MATPPDNPGRHAPASVKRLLRQEVGYGCPVSACASPYLEYHHFDPPWAKEHHHRPEGMIALCGPHHDKAGGGAFTVEQLRQFKRSSYALSAPVRGRFDWRRRDLVARIGGTFYVRTPVLVAIRGEPVVWQRRDEDDTLLLSLHMLSTSGDVRLQMVDHEWYVVGSPSDFESPPSGRRIHARYDNGDQLTIEFWEAATPDALSTRYSTPEHQVIVPTQLLEFPVAVADIEMAIPGNGISFSKDESQIGGSRFRGTWSIDNAVGMNIG